MAEPLPQYERHGLTHRDLDETPDDGRRYEVIDGALYVSPFPFVEHQHVVTELVTLLHRHARAHELGRVFTSGLKVVLDVPTGVGPDVVFIGRDQLDGLEEDGFYGAPRLLVEVLSSKPALDTVVKMQKYARSGVPHYWIVDPKRRELRAYALDGEEYRLDRSGHDTEAFACPAPFEGLTIPLRELWLS